MVQKANLTSGGWPRRGLIGLTVVAAYATAGFLLAPWLIERTLTSTLAERLSLETRIGDLSLNPFSLSLTVDGLSMTEEDGQPFLSFEQLFVNFQLSSLFHWAWAFDEIHLTRPAFRFERISESETNLNRLAERWAATAAEPADTPEPAPADENPIPRLKVADLRIIDGRVTVIDQTPAEAFRTELSAINLAVTEFSTLPDEGGRQQVTIRTESGARIALAGSLSVNPLTLTGEIELEGTYTPVLFRYFRDELALPVSFEGGDLNARLDYSIEMEDDGQIRARLENLSSELEGLRANQPDRPSLVELGELSVSGASLAWPERIVHIERVGLDQVLIQAFRDPDGAYLPAAGTATDTASVSAPGPESAPRPDSESGPSSAPDSNPPPVESDTAGWQVTIGTVALADWRLVHTDTTLEDGQLEISDLALTLKNFALDDEQSMPLSVSLALQPAGSLEMTGQLRLFPAFRLEGTITGSTLALAAAQPYLNSVANIGIESGSIGFTGDIAAGGEVPFEYRGDFHLTDLSLIDRAQKEPLFSWSRLSVDKLVATPSALELSLLSIDEPYARVEIEEDGTTNIARTFVEEPAPAGDAIAADDMATRQPEPEADPLQIIVGETHIAGGSAYFTDLALPLRFEAEVTGIDGQLSTLATSSREPARVDLKGQVNEYGQLNIDGHISAFAPDRDTDISIDFDNVDLPRMTPYTIKFAGRAIAEGRTDLTLTYQLKEGDLAGNNRLVIRDLTLGDKVEQPGAMDLPLDMAVALLKDGEGNVDFSFPVSGTLGDPAFSYSGAVMKALSNVIGGIVAAPFRLLGSLVGMAPDELEHVGFEPGESTITPPQRETLVKLSEALQQRPQLVLQVSPVVSTEADRLAIAEALVDESVSGRIAEHPNQSLSRLEQQRQVLESLYDEAGLQPERNTVVEAHQSEDDAGDIRLDVPAYAADLRKALVAAREVTELDLNALATERLAAIRTALTSLAALPEERIEAMPQEAVALNDDGLVQMSLNVTIAD